MDTIQNSILNFFGRIPDPRINRTKSYTLPQLLFIALCTYLTGGESFYDMQDFARNRFKWLHEVTGLQKVPSHDTFCRVFQIVLPEAFHQVLSDLATQLRTVTEGDIIAFDGKTHRGTWTEDRGALHTVNVWSSKNSISLAQMPVDVKTNEITAIPTVMDQLELKGNIITVDALNCQTAIAAKCVEKKCDYVFPVRNNHPNLLKNIVAYFEKFIVDNDPVKTIDKGYERIETRRCWQSTDLSFIEDKKKWAGIKSIGLVECSRIDLKTDEHSEYRRYYISSLPLDPYRLLECSRTHWEIENCLHWTLDVVFKEDESRSMARNSAKNLGILRLIALNILRSDPKKISLKRKRMHAARIPDYLIELLTGKVNDF